MGQRLNGHRPKNPGLLRVGACWIGGLLGFLSASAGCTMDTSKVETVKPSALPASAYYRVTSPKGEEQLTDAVFRILDDGEAIKGELPCKRVSSAAVSIAISCFAEHGSDAVRAWYLPGTRTLTLKMSQLDIYSEEPIDREYFRQLSANILETLEAGFGKGNIELTY